MSEEEKIECVLSSLIMEYFLEYGKKPHQIDIFEYLDYNKRIYDGVIIVNHGKMIREIDPLITDYLIYTILYDDIHQYNNLRFENIFKQRMVEL